MSISTTWRPIGLATTALAVAITPSTAAHADSADIAAEISVAEAGEAAPQSIDYDRWLRDVQQAVDAGIPYVKERATNAKNEKQAIVLDVDNTSLETHFHPLPPTPAVGPVLELVRYAEAQGVDIFFVTARPSLLNPVTEYNLKKVGYPVDGLFEQGIGDVFRPVTEYKTARRTEIEARGYKIIANIGNSDHDLIGGHSESVIKLPDYEGELS